MVFHLRNIHSLIPYSRNIGLIVICQASGNSIRRRTVPTFFQLSISDIVFIQSYIATSIAMNIYLYLTIFSTAVLAIPALTDCSASSIVIRFRFHSNPEQTY